jgi:arylsulfatase A-like enzyme
MIHVMLSHRPTMGNEHCEFDGNRETTRANVIIQSRCGLMGVVDVLRRMRELGIYQQSLIVLMGDHGAWVPVDALMNEQDSRSGARMGVAMATPVLAIKPPGAMGNIRVSGAPTSVVDVPATISDLLGLETQFDGTPVFSISNEAPRLRRHLFYKFGMNPDAEGYLFPIWEYGVYGSTLDARAWRLDARHFPAVATEGVSDAP